MNGHRAVLSGLHLSRRQLFDTHYVIKELSEKGFTHDQAVAICDVFHSIQREGDAIFCDNVTSLDLLRELERSARANIDQLRNEMRQLREEMAVSVEQQKLFAKQTEVANRFDSRCEKILADNQIASVDAALRNVERKCTGRLSAVQSEVRSIKGTADVNLVNQRWMISSLVIGGMSLLLSFVRFVVLR
eukprot:NODE_4046_length_871_cov_157.394161_g3732_i0.p1 GENE.NODE_4046_length_871_cov_157.394161_g3732_i0~~NODE_4046_length_871_cov_157.394161_g3732_i0.p1  ORF type:complete len:189 (-),score=49.72 NODE_4046_length_871_cov_157.394161_g3732_i0:167-733(-)